MKMKKQRLFFNLWFVILLVQLLPAATATITVPGVSENLNSYLKGADVKAHDNCIYNLNELLLFEKLPTVGETKEALFKLYLRKLNRVNKITLHDVRRQHVIDLNQSFTYSLRSIFTHHSAIKDFLTRAASDPYAPVRFSLTKPAELQGAKYLLKLLGLTLFRSSTGEYGLHDASSPPNYENNRYYKITNIVWLRLQRALNKTGHLEFQLKEDKAELPESLEFFSTVTALPLTADNFLETLSQNRQLQLLLGMIYRLGKNEIAYISQLEPDLTAWKRIYHNGAFLSGMFFLSHSLRVEEGRIQLPGGGAAGAVWDTLAGTPHHPPSLDFLAQVATLDDGKLNYLYTFSFFLPTESRNALFNTNDPQRALALYRLVSLGRKEKLENLTLPSLHDQGFFTLMYALQTRDGKFFFPGGIAAWTKAVGAKENNVVSLLETLGKNQEKKNGIGCFMAVYSKFLQRHELMTPEVIETLYKNYGKYNVLVDFVEKIPFKNPDTVLKMFSWVKSLESTKGSDKKKESLTAILQSVLELLSRAARNNDAPVDYDGIVLQLTAIPFSAPEAYDGYFQFFENYLAYDPQEADDSFMEFALSGITNRPLTLHEQNYRLESFNFKKTGTVKIMKSQSVCSLSQLAQINRLLAEAATAPNPTTIQAIKTAFESLPQAELPPDAPLILRKSATSYSTKTLLKRVNKLTGKLEKKAEKKEILSLIRELKGSFLLHDLKNYLVTCIYAVSSHDSNLRLFITPNMTRFHDFSVSKGKSPWRHSAVAKELGKEDVYHLEGGLSRMNITLAGAASEFLFRREIGYFPVQTAPIVYNNLDLFPKPNIGKAQEYTGLLVQLARHLMEKAPQSADVREFLKTEISGMTTGYFYHRMLLHLEGKTKDFRPPYSYLLRLGESLAACKRFMDDFPGKQRLEALRSPMEIKTLNRRMNRLGSIYYYTFGKLLPHRYRLFPLPLSNFFRSKRVGGEMINEMKVKAAYISYDQEMPSQFLGYFILSHLYNFSHQYSQAYNNDYERTHYLYGLYNYLYVKNTFKKLKTTGVLRISE